jgi:hypothetical protein
LSFDLPLHARYQAPTSDDAATHRNVSIGAPLVFVQCGGVVPLSWRRAVLPSSEPGANASCARVRADECARSRVDSACGARQ